MAVAALVPLSEYLSRTYHPDREYLEGELKERNVGETGHSSAQGLSYLYLMTNFMPRFWAGVEVRVQVKADRFRIPDVTVVPGPDPEEPYIRSAPVLAIEVLSPDDTAAELQAKIDDYLSMGIPTVWVIHPKTKRGFIYSGEGSREPADGILRAGDISMPLSAIFPSR